MDELEEKTKKARCKRRRVHWNMWMGWVKAMLKIDKDIRTSEMYRPYKDMNLWILFGRRLEKIRGGSTDVELPKGWFHQYNQVLFHDELVEIWEALDVFNYDKKALEQNLYFKGHEDYMKEIGAFPLFFFSFFLILGSNIVGFLPVIYIFLFLLFVGTLTRNVIIVLLLLTFLLWSYFIFWPLYYISVVIAFHVIALGSNRLIYKTYINVFLNEVVYFGFIRPFHVHIQNYENYEDWAGYCKETFGKTFFVRVHGQLVFDLLNNVNCTGIMIDFVGWFTRSWKKSVEEFSVLALTGIMIQLSITFCSLLVILNLNDKFPINLFEFEYGSYGIIGFVIVWLVLTYGMSYTKGLTGYWRDKRGRPCSRFIRASFYYFCAATYIVVLCFSIYHFNIPIKMMDAYGMFYYWLLWGFLFWFEKNLNRRYLIFFRINYLMHPYIFITLYLIIHFLLGETIVPVISDLYMSPLEYHVELSTPNCGFEKLQEMEGF